MMKRNSYRYFAESTLFRQAVLWGDLFLVAAVTLFIQYLTWDYVFWSEHAKPMVVGLVVTVFLYGISLGLFKAYSTMVCSTAKSVLLRTMASSLAGGGLTWLVAIGTSHSSKVVFLDGYGLILQAAVIALLLCMERWFLRGIIERTQVYKVEKVAIYGVDDCGFALAKSAKEDPNGLYNLVAFISDEASDKSMVMDTKVCLNGTGIAAEMALLGVDTLWISPLKNDDFRNNASMVDEFLNAGIRIKMVREKY